MSWGSTAQIPAPDWTMSVSLENVSRGNQQVPEVTNLREAIKAWQLLDKAAQEVAILILERPVTIDGAQVDRLKGHGINTLAERLDD